MTRDQNRTAIRTDAIRPGDFRVGLRVKQFAVGSIQRIEEAVAVGLDQNRIADRVPIMHVVRRELIMPFEFARAHLGCASNSEWRLR